MNSDDEYDYFGDENAYPPDEVDSPGKDEEELRDKGISEDDSQGSFGYMIEEEGPNFVAEAKIFERVGGRGGLGTEIGGIGEPTNKLKDIQKIANRENLSESEKFTIVAITYFNNFRDSDIISFPDGEIKGMLSLIPRIQNLKYKNPLGLIFGYYVLGKDKEISKEKFNNFVKFIYPKLEEGIITLPDVIRYARYLQKIF